MVRLWVRRTGTGESDLDGSFLAGMVKQLIGWGGAYGDKFCFASALSVSRCVCAMVAGEPEEELERERGQFGICSSSR